jgi:hypothetical protein
VASRAVPGLDLDQDLAFQERSWRVERIVGWGMVVLVVAALLGLLGAGPLSRAEVTSDALQLQYPRFSRVQSSETLKVRIGADAVRDRETRLWVDRRYLDDSRIESILPPPVRVEAAPDRLVLAFAVAEPGRPLEVTLTLQPERIGVLRGALGLESAAAGPGLAFRQVVYP